MLAARAVIRRPLADPAALDRLATRNAGQGVTIIDPQILLKVAGLSLATDKIAQGGSALADRLAQNLPHRFHQPLAFGQRDPARRPRRVDPGGKQRLIGVNVADPHNYMVVHDEGLDRQRSTLGALMEISAGEPLVERLRPKRLE